MARTWLSVRVELLGGHGERLWPYPGRVMLVGPTHTFAHLAEAIDLAFARWDRAHLCQFTLTDGTVITDAETGMELADSPFGPLEPEFAELTRTKVRSRVGVGDEFKYLFDFGDDWAHVCTVEESEVDPVEVLGATPKRPTASWGWGSIPDQYGRRWSDDDGTDERAPRRPVEPHPMLSDGWPQSDPRPVDARELRGATYRRDVPAILAAIEGRDVDDALQQVGLGLQIALTHGSDGRAMAFAGSLLNRLTLRGATGDDVLVEDLVAQLRGTPVAARHLAVDLTDLVAAMTGDPDQPGDLLDLETGEVVPAALTDAGLVGDDDVIDVDSEPDRWLEIERVDTRVQWQDMADFAEGQVDSGLRERLTAALEGKGAFRRFRDAVHREDVVEQWRRFSDDLGMGRARAYLALEGIRVRVPDVS